MAHQKHAKLSRLTIGNFARHEWAIMGAPCGVIQKLARAIAEQSKIQNPKSKIGYVDADHKMGDDETQLNFATEYTDKIGFHRLDLAANLTPFQYRSLFNETDMVLVNGNHFEANRQILVLDERKYESLSRKVNRLTQVDMFLTSGSIGGLFGLYLPKFLEAQLPHWQEIPVYDIENTNSIVEYLHRKMKNPLLKGLILAGGRSTRMGRDKANLDYHGKPQHEYLADILRGLHIEPFISCRAEQATEFEKYGKVISDTFLELGPMGAILSAFREDPNAAWLVLACDLPLLDEAILNELIEKRDPSVIATSFKNPESAEGFPEPLIAIWEPRAYPVLLQFLSQGISCPRKVLINSTVELLTPSVPAALMNVNTPEDLAKAKAQLDH